MTQSFWLDPSESLAGPVEGDLTADVAVVGAGICGTSAALALADAGVDVVLIEAERVASQATGRNAGFILQGTAERYDRARVQLGETRAKDIHAWSLLNHDRIAATVEQHSIDCDYRRGGSLQLAGSEHEEKPSRSSA